MDLEIDLEQLRKRKLFIATPMYGGVCSHDFHVSCIQLAVLSNGYQLPLQFSSLVNESLVQRGRNQLVHRFLKTDCTHFMFIDADIGFKAQDVLALLALADPKSDKDIICGPYPKKTIAWENIKQAVKQGKADENADNLASYVGDYVLSALNKNQKVQLDELSEVQESGTGFMLIQRHVFDKFKANYPEKIYKSDYKSVKDIPYGEEMVAYFDCIIDPKTKRYLSEDYMFCQYARKMGCKLWICPWVELNHVGSYTYQGSLSSIGSIGVTAT